MILHLDAKKLTLLYANNKGSDQTAQIYRLITACVINIVFKLTSCKLSSMIACFQILLITTISYCDFVYANVLSYEINIV